MVGLADDGRFKGSPQSCVSEAAVLRRNDTGDSALIDDIGTVGRPSIDAGWVSTTYDSNDVDARTLCSRERGSFRLTTVVETFIVAVLHYALIFAPHLFRSRQCTVYASKAPVGSNVHGVFGRLGLTSS